MLGFSAGIFSSTSAVFCIYNSFFFSCDQMRRLSLIFSGIDCIEFESCTSFPCSCFTLSLLWWRNVVCWVLCSCCLEDFYQSMITDGEFTVSPTFSAVLDFFNETILVTDSSAPVLSYDNHFCCSICISSLHQKYFTAFSALGAISPTFRSQNSV